MLQGFGSGCTGDSGGEGSVHVEMEFVPFSACSFFPAHSPVCLLAALRSLGQGFNTGSRHEALKFATLAVRQTSQHSQGFHYPFAGFLGIQVAELVPGS